ncbi:hypothetical protein ACN6LM_006780 [Streptomyces sp. SAS_281]|uniref:hypothetical protein n=1 Tax=Streptomyces sp. SAS_281 TaxID=3412744 RepID=UPI00403CAA1D
MGRLRHLGDGFTALLAQADAEGDLDWAAADDCSIIRTHQRAAGARQKGLWIDLRLRHLV